MLFRRSRRQILGGRKRGKKPFERFYFFVVVVELRSGVGIDIPRYAAHRAGICVAEVCPLVFVALFGELGDFGGNLRRASLVAVERNAPLFEIRHFFVDCGAVLCRSLDAFFVGFPRLFGKVRVRRGKPHHRRRRKPRDRPPRRCFQRRRERFCGKRCAVYRERNKPEHSRHARKSADSRKRKGDCKPRESLGKERCKALVVGKHTAHSFQEVSHVRRSGGKLSADGFGEVAPRVGELFELADACFGFGFRLSEARRRKFLYHCKLFLLRLALGKRGDIFLQRGCLALHCRRCGFDRRHNVHFQGGGKSYCRAYNPLHLFRRNAH